jgi:hypothetical protein
MAGAAATTFAPHMDEYLKRDGLTDATGEGAPDVKGKLLPLDVRERAVASGIYTYLRHDVRATTPEEVGTIVWLEWGEESGARYAVEGRPDQTFTSSIQTCVVTVVDRAARKIVGREKLTSDQDERVQVSKAQAETRGELLSERPVAKVMAYLETLPRR